MNYYILNNVYDLIGFEITRNIYIYIYIYIYMEMCVCVCVCVCVLPYFSPTMSRVSCSFLFGGFLEMRCKYRYSFCFLGMLLPEFVEYGSLAFFVQFYSRFFSIRNINILYIYIYIYYIYHIYIYVCVCAVCVLCVCVCVLVCVCVCLCLCVCCLYM